MKTTNYYNYLDRILYIYDLTIDKYLNENTPCKDCLVNTICLNDKELVYGKNNLPILKIKLCKKLKNFVENNNKYRGVACVREYEINLK